MTNAEILGLLSDHPVQDFGLKLAWEAVVTVEGRQDFGVGPLGHVFKVPITGGAFRGGPDYPDLKGEILAGGADKQLLRNDGIKELRADYEMRVDDETIIGVSNRVIIDQNVKPRRYAASRLHVSSPKGKWDWMNRRLFIGSLQSHQPNTGYVVIRGFEVLV